MFYLNHNITVTFTLLDKTIGKNNDFSNKKRWFYYKFTRDI